MTALETCKQWLLIGAIIFLAFVICLCLIRAIRGPRIADRIVAVNMIGTIVIILIALLSYYLNESYLTDVALIYAMISFLAVIVLTKVYLGVYIEQKQKKRDQREEKK